MKPKDLPRPFTWEERHPCFHDGVIYLPSFYQDYHAWNFPSFSEIFHNDRAVSCELCSGNGDWIVQQALQFPHINWIAVEKRFDRVRKIWSKVCNHKLTNIVIVCGEAQTLFQHYLDPESISSIKVHFPDPWPKHRHAKHRLFQDDFVHNIAQKLLTNGELVLVTDDRNYMEESISVISQYLRCGLSGSRYEEVIDNYGSSWFENLWRGKGKTIFRTVWYKPSHNQIDGI